MDKCVSPFIEFNITQKCNYCCDYCSQGFLNKKEPEKLFHASDEVIDGFIDFLKTLGSEYEINLIGGEPFCHPKFIETARRIAELGNKIIVYTNLSFPVSSFKNLIEASGECLKLIHGALHISEIKDLDKNIENVITINRLLAAPSCLRVVSVVTEENFGTLKSVDKKLMANGVEFIYIRLIKPNGEISTYSDEIEKHLKLREHKYNIDMLNARKIDTSKVLCHAGSKLLHILANGNIMRCWSPQLNERFRYFGNVTDKESINLLKSPMPCFAKTCFCQHPTARNAYFEVGDIVCSASK